MNVLQTTMAEPCGKITVADVQNGTGSKARLLELALAAAKAFESKNVCLETGWADALAKLPHIIDPQEPKLPHRPGV